MDNIPSRKYYSPTGRGILVFSGDMDTISVEFVHKEDNSYGVLYLTDRDNIMRTMTEKCMINYVLSDGDFEKLVSVIEQYGTKQ